MHFSCGIQLSGWRPGAGHRFIEHNLSEIFTGCAASHEDMEDALHHLRKLSVLPDSMALVMRAVDEILWKVEWKVTCLLPCLRDLHALCHVHHADQC